MIKKFKNKTIMDYEKKYKDAIQRAKHALDCDRNNLVSTDVPLIYSMFPELKESEDEKVRKALIEMVHDTTGDELWVDYNVHKEEALDWLEKQGETYTKRDVDNAYIEGMAFAKNELEKQGEQNPIEWDEYDEMYVSALIAIVRKEDATTQILRDTLTGWLRCLKGRFKKD